MYSFQKMYSGMPDILCDGLFRVHCWSISFESYQCYMQQISRNIINDLMRAIGPEVKS